MQFCPAGMQIYRAGMQIYRAGMQIYRAGIEFDLQLWEIDNKNIKLLLKIQNYEVLQQRKLLYPVGDFGYAVAKIALEDKPQLLESIGKHTKA